MSADDAEADAAITRVNAIRAHHSQPHVPSTVRDPDDARAELRRVCAAARALSHAMQGSDAGVAMAFDAYECEADPVGLPGAVAAAVAMTPAGIGSAVSAAVSAAVAAWRGSAEADTALQRGEEPTAAVRRIRGGIERAVWHISSAATAALPDGGRDLAERLDGWLAGHTWARAGAPDYEGRLRRAACMMMLGQLTADAGMCGLAHELARRENRCRPWLPIAHVFDRMAFIVERLGGNPPAGAVIAELRAELALLDGVPYLPDDNGTTGA
ncbi:hypothetical protein HMPREF0591_4865 [Mycobacterium parascrofulaceum ATCC BAA-614]|uniref:Uncharacterized protein n=1 Tax=Mycobacterium parascrofulaceum ATCC BAA-614 TaxID=525368 RepID=D5PFB7_9MYCO|nr:hypothetical protein [Mycobacterium parascrofulaceum]EFG75187.1 hypothetical protein HMPREF0591_4865 [Mycobacterium parascrofulaceum ATCC BAA-614]